MGILDNYKGSDILKGLRGLKGLSEQERRVWDRDNAEKIKGQSQEQIERIYANQQFIKRYGLNAFKSLDVNQRDNIYRKGVINRAITNIYSPYTTNKKGQTVFDANKGVGNTATYEKIKQLSDESKIDLLNSGYKTISTINKENNTFKHFKPGDMITSPSAPLITLSVAHNNENTKIVNSLKKENNDTILDGIIYKDEKRKKEAIQPLIDEYTVKELGKLSNSQIKQDFYKAVKSNGQFYVYFGDKPSENRDEIKKFSIQDMRDYLGTMTMYNAIYGAEATNSYADHFAKDYIADHKGLNGNTEDLLNAIGIGITTYVADGINHLRQNLYDPYQSDSKVWVNTKGEVIDPDRVKSSNKGFYYIDGKGKKQDVHTTIMTRTALDYLGKDENGKTRSAFFNNQFMSDAEQYGTLNWDEQRKYKEIGYSPYTRVLKPGESDIVFEGLKMSYFAIKDGAEQLIPFGFGKLGKALKMANAVSKVQKLANITGKTLDVTSKVMKGIIPTNNAFAIGHAYGRGAFGENIQSNLLKLEENAKSKATTNFKQRYNEDKQFKNTVDSQVQKVYLQLKAEQLKQMKDGGMQITDKNLNDKLLKDKAKAIVGEEFITNEYKDIQSSKKYNDAIGQAASIAATGAMVASVTDAAKYALVNNFGFRKFLTSTSEERAVAAANKLIKNVTEGADKKLITPSSTLQLLAKGINKEKAKTLGAITAKQTWGGAWTNFTDEMQSWGGKQINEDAFTSYLNNQYDGDASDKVYGALDYITSYFKGANAALDKSSTWNAGLVGGIGGFSPLNLNVHELARTIATKEGRKSWNNKTTLEKINTIINNGVISDYYAKKYGAQNLQNAINEVNNSIEETDKFNNLKKLLSLDRATMEVNNEHDKDALTLIKGLRSILLLHRFNSDAGIHEQHINDNSFLGKLKNKFKTEDDATLRALAQKSSILKDAIDELNTITQGNLTKEEASKYLDEYYENNPSIPRTEENDNKALQDIQENAQQLLQAEQQVNDISTKLDGVEEKRGSKISDKVRDNLIVKKALDTFLGDRISKLEQKISGKQEISEENTTLNTIGGKEKALEIHESETKKSLADIITRRDKQKEEVDKIQKEIDDFKESHSDKSLTQEEFNTLKGLENKLSDAQLQHQYLQNMIDEGKSYLERIQSLKEQPTRVLSKEEILNLSPEERARMLDDANKGNYTKEQLKIINDLKRELTLKDPSILQDIQDIAHLNRRRKANAKAYQMILDNPEAAASRLEAEEAMAADVANNVMLQRVIDRLDKMHTKFYSNSDYTPTEVNDAFYFALRQYNSSFLKALKNKLDRDNIAPSYASQLNDAMEWSDFTTEISKGIDNMELSNEEKEYFRKNVDSLIEDAKSKKEALDILNNVVNSKEVNSSDSNKFKNLLTQLTGVQKTKNSTIVETKEEKIKRQEVQKEQAKQEKKKIQDAESQSIEVTAKEASNDKNTQEAYQETEEERSNEQNAQEAIEVTDKEATNDKYAEEHKEEGLSGEDVDLGLESPTLEQQVAPVKSKQDSPVINVIEVKPDTTDQGNIMTSTSENMQGNTMYGYDIVALEDDAKEVERTGRDPNDRMSGFFNWFKTAKIKLQEIIDNELNDIIKSNNKIEILYVNPQDNATNDKALDGFPLLCVEYTDNVKKLHKENRGGVITANGKQYLIVGSLGFDRRNPAQGNTFRSTVKQGKDSSIKYFNENPSERFYVDPNVHTEVEQMTSGRIVREMIGDIETKIRPVTELLSDPNRNPKGLKLQDLKWGIQYNEKFATVGVSERNTVYPPRDSSSNAGAIFLLIEAANGNYIPAAIRPTMLSDLNEGTLKTQLNDLFNNLTSTNYADRRKAINQLVQLLYLNEKTDNILIGTKELPTISIVKNGVVLRTFNVANSNFNRMDLINAIYELNPRINITLSTLSNPTQLKIFAEAGALNTDIAKLGTSNASYTVYAMNENGKPIKTKPIENSAPSLTINSDLEKADYKKKHSVYYKGSQYREKNGKWYDSNWKEVTDPLLLNQIKWSSYIRRNDLTPDLISNDKYGNKDINYYIIDSNDSSAKVIKVFKNGAIAELNIFESRDIINRVKEKEAKDAREKAAKEEKERLERAEKAKERNNIEQLNEGETVNLDNQLTDEQLIAQSNGDFTSTAKPQSTDSEVKAQEVVNNIITDTHDIVLNEKKGVYIDSTGKKYARVTAVIQAIVGAERFDPNSPWILPSTRIGTGIDEFVRDFFAGKLGNLDNLHERYPNASLPQLQYFENQLRKLKANFDKRGLTVVPRDVTVTGEVEVTDSNGKKYKLPVAGTLDLLAYDKDGNFYIFDMKTNRSAPNDKKSSKWSKQLSLYKQFLEEKYGVNVKGTEIIPIEVSYPAPKGWGNATTEYSNNGNQLYADSVEYRDAKPTLHSNIPITTSPVKVEYNLLTEEEKSMLSPSIDGTFNSTTGTINKESVNKSKEDINKTGNKSLAELQDSANAKPTNANSILKSRTYSKKVREILKEKGFSGKPSEAEAWLKKHNMPIDNITDIDAWIDMLQNCRKKESQ